MPSTEEKVLKIVKESGGKASSFQIAKELRMSSGYLSLLLQSLRKKGKIEFSGARTFSVRRGPREELPKKRAKKPKLRTKISLAVRGKKKKAGRPLKELKGLTKELEATLRKAGYKKIEVLAEVSISRLMEGTGLELKQAAYLINEARRILKIIPNYSYGRRNHGA